MKKTVIIFILIAASTLLTSCGQDKDKVATTKEGTSKAPVSILLVFDDRESGVEPYSTRMVITDKFLHIDDEPEDKNSFVLFDRKKQTIYSVSSENNTILVIPPMPVTQKPPAGVIFEEIKTEASDAPALAGKPTSHYRYAVNGKVCHEVYSVEGVLDEAVKALSEYRHVLAGQHAIVMQRLPMDVQEPCDLFVNIFEPSRHLEHGFPVLDIDQIGHHRLLVDYDTHYAPDPGLFKLPEDYPQLSLDEITGNMQTGGH